MEEVAKHLGPYLYSTGFLVWGTNQHFKTIKSLLSGVGSGEAGEREDSPEHHKILAASVTSVHQMPGAPSHPRGDSRTTPGPRQVSPKRRPNLPQERITDLLKVWISFSKMDSLFLGVSTYFVRTTLTQVCLCKLISPWGLTHLARTIGSPAKVWVDSGPLCWAMWTAPSHMDSLLPSSFLPSLLLLFCCPQSHPVSSSGSVEPEEAGGATSRDKGQEFSLWMGVEEAFSRSLGCELLHFYSHT